MGKSLGHYGLQDLCKDVEMRLRRTRDISDALDAPIPTSRMEERKLLTTEQRAAYKCIIAHVKEGKPGLFFIDGPGGTGKTFSYNSLYAKVRLLNKIVLPTTTSGIAASNMPTGRTAHPRFKIPNDCGESLSCNVGKQLSLAALTKEASLIIWNEASMAGRENIEALDLLLRDLCLPNVPFGGKIVVLGGDFRQTVPVVRKKTQQEVIEYSLFCSPLWPLFTRLQHTQNIRARDDPTFSKFLLALGNGALQTEETARIAVPSALRLQCGASPACMDDLLRQIYPTVSTTYADPDMFTDRAILTLRNEDVDLINALLIEKFCGDECSYKSLDTIIDDDCKMYPTEFLNTLCPRGMSPHNLVLKCEIFTGFSKGEFVLLPRIILRAPDSSGYPFQFHRVQFPIKLYFAMTINKSQGQTLQDVGVYIRQPCFSHGQLYVGLSRARKASKMWLLDETAQEKCNESLCTTNVVSYQLLQKEGIIEKPDLRYEYVV